MDGKVLLKRIYKIHDDTQRKLKSFHRQYQAIAAAQEDSGMSFGVQTYRDTSSTAVATSLRAIDKVRNLDVEVVDFTEALQKKLLNVLPDSPIKLKRLLDKEVKQEPIITEGVYDLPQSFYKTAHHINQLNNVLAQIGLIAKEIEKILDKKVIKLEYISVVSYDRAKSVLTINSKKQTVGDRSQRKSALLTALFGDKRHNLVSHDVDDARVFEMIKEIDPEKYKNKTQQRKCALDAYKRVNDEIRKKIPTPNGEDLIIRRENGFTINPKLVK